MVEKVDLYLTAPFINNQEEGALCQKKAKLAKLNKKQFINM